LTLTLVSGFRVYCATPETGGEDVRIGELSERTGVSVRSLRHYERRGLIEAKRLSNGYREFDESVIERIRRIRSLLAIGFTIDDILPLARCLDDEAFDERRACDEAIALHRPRDGAGVRAKPPSVRPRRGASRLAGAASRRRSRAGSCCWRAPRARGSPDRSWP